MKIFTFRVTKQKKWNIPKLKLPKLKKRIRRTGQKGKRSIIKMLRGKRVVIGVVTCVFLLGIAAIAAPGRALEVIASKRELPIYSVEKESKVVSLSFDAAWGNEDTQMLIDILGKYQIPATFFVVGEWVDKYPESVKALFDAGHEIMNHSSKHDHFTKLTPKQITDDLNVCNDKIEAVTGVRPTLFRAPYGDYNDSVVRTVKEAGMLTIQWDVDSLDWKDLSAPDIIKRVTARVNPGSIVLFHNAAKNTPAALPGLIEQLIQKGYTFLPISKLIYTENYIIDHTGKQISN